MKGKKSEYLCKMKFECMSCGKKVLSENRTLHIKISHKGDKNIMSTLLARSPDDPQRIRVASVFELFFDCSLIVL